jgi:hypothetical protein
MVTTAFEVDNKNKLFGYTWNTLFYLWDPLLFTFKPQVNKKQIQAVLQTVDKGTPRKREGEKQK